MRRQSLCRTCRFGVVAVLAAAVCHTAVRAEEPAGEDVPAQSAEDSLERWIHHLSAGGFDRRREAQQQLLAGGVDVVPALTEEALTGGRAAALVCLELLARLQRADDDATRAAADAALQTLAASDNPVIAERVRALTAQPGDAEQIVEEQQRGAVLPIQVQLRQAAARPFDENGRREVDVEKDGRSIHIEEIRDEGIVVRITEVVDGEERTRDVEAASAAELRRTDAEAYDYYRDHLLQGGEGAVALNAQIQAVPIGNRRVTVSEADGERVIQVNAEDQQIEIRHRDGRDIAVRITEEVAGEPRTRVYEAADEAELRENHPEAAELYRRFGWKGGGLGIQALFGGAGLPGEDAGDRSPSVDEARRAVADALAEVREIAESIAALRDAGGADGDALADLARRLATAEAHLHAARSRLTDPLERQ